MFEEGVYANYAPASLYSNYSNYSELEVSHSPLTTNGYIQPEFCILLWNIVSFIVLTFLFLSQ